MRSAGKIRGLLTDGRSGWLLSSAAGVPLGRSQKKAATAMTPAAAFFCFASVLFLRGGDWLYRRHGLEDVIEQGR